MAVPTIPNPRTWTDKEFVSYDLVKTELYDTLWFLMNPPLVKLRQTSGQTLTTATWTAITWNLEDMDAYGFHSTTSNPTRIIPKVPGWYRGWMSIGFNDSSSAGNYRLVSLAKNGTRTRSRHDSRPAVTAGQDRTPHGVPFYVFCNGTTDYLEVHAYHDVGSTIALHTSIGLRPEFFLRWLAPSSGDVWI